MLCKLCHGSAFEKGPIKLYILKKFYGFPLEKKYFRIDIERQKILKFSNTNEIDLCTSCWSQKAVLTNVTYQYFDGTFKFGPVCVDCFDIDEFNESTSRFIRQGHFYFGRWVPGETPKIFFKD